MRSTPLLLFTCIVATVTTSVFAQTVVVAEKPEFRALVPEGAVVEKLATGFKFAEGPAWNPTGKFLVFSDNVDDKIYQYDAATMNTWAWPLSSGMSNGNTYNAKGDFFSCQQDPHRVAVTRVDGTTELYPDGWEGKAFSSPNDVVVKSDGTVWFTDPTYGLGGRKREQATNNVYCYNPQTKTMRAVATDFDQPNGLAFSPDEKKLYITDTGKPHHIRVFDVGADDQISNGRVFCVVSPGAPDGIRCDTSGDVWSSAGDGVQVFNPAGERLGRIRVPEAPANLQFGATDEKGLTDLYLTARSSLYRVKVTAVGAPPP